MKRTNLTVMALCAMLLGAGAALAHDKHHDNQKFPATGQTTVYAVGDDGYSKAGAALKYKNNGDGTITDQNTGLMWEVKDDYNGSPNPDDLNAVNNYYRGPGPAAGPCVVRRRTASRVKPVMQAMARAPGIRSSNG